MNRCQANVMILVLMGVTGLLSWAGLTDSHNWGGDAAAYIMQAASLTQGRPGDFVEINRYTVEHSSYPMGPVVYPWGFPFLLAPIYAAFGLNLAALKCAGVICFVLLIPVIWVGFRSAHAPAWRVGLICLFAVNPNLLAFLNQILSDIPFLLFSTLSVILIGRLVVERRGLISPAGDAVLLGACMAAAFFIRINGVLLPVALLSTQLFAQRRGRWRINVLPYAVFLGLFAVWRALLPAGEASYLTYLHALSPSMIYEHLIYYARLGADFFAGVPFHHFVYYIALALALVGAYRRRRSDFHAVVYILLTLGLYILWPSTQGLRFLFPVLPFALSFMLTGMEALAAHAPGRRSATAGRLAVHVFVAFILCSFCIQIDIDISTNLQAHRRAPLGPATQTSRNMFAYVRANAPEQSTVAFFRPRIMTMMTGRKSVMINHVRDLPRLSPGDYLCIYMSPYAFDQIEPEKCFALLEQNMFELQLHNDDFLVLRVTRKPH